MWIRKHGMKISSPVSLYAIARVTRKTEIVSSFYAALVRQHCTIELIISFWRFEVSFIHLDKVKEKLEVKHRKLKTRSVFLPLMVSMPLKIKSNSLGTGRLTGNKEGETEGKGRSLLRKLRRGVEAIWRERRETAFMFLQGAESGAQGLTGAGQPSPSPWGSQGSFFNWAEEQSSP